MSAFPWWFELTLEEPHARFSKCPRCSEEVDSTDVLCPKDDVSLLGAIVSEEQTPWIVNSLRAAATAAALAIGYLGWAWPAYILAVVLGVGLAALFTRNHALPKKLLIGGSALFMTLHWILMSIGNGKYLPVARMSYLAVAAVGELGFLIAFTLQASDDHKSWRKNFGAGARTILIGAASMTVAAFSMLWVVASTLLSSRSAPILLIPFYLMILAGSVGTVGLLASAIAYTLNAPAFAVTDPLTFRRVLDAISVPRLPTPPSRHVHGVLDRLITVIANNGVAFANRVLSALGNRL